jgi:uncharacterized protein
MKHYLKEIKMFRKAIILLVLIFGLSLMGCTTAQKSRFGMSSTGKSKKESVEELLILTKAEKLIDIMYGQTDEYIKNMSKQLGVKPEDQEQFDKFMSKAASMMKEEMTWEKLKEPTIEIYMKYYTEKEIQDMIAFYKSESGQSVISKLPDVTKDTTILRQKMVEEVFPKIIKLSKELEAELAKKRNNQ